MNEDIYLLYCRALIIMLKTLHLNKGLQQNSPKRHPKKWTSHQSRVFIYVGRFHCSLSSSTCLPLFTLVLQASAQYYQLFVLGISIRVQLIEWNFDLLKCKLTVYSGAEMHTYISCIIQVATSQDLQVYRCQALSVYVPCIMLSHLILY